MYKNRGGKLPQRVAKERAWRRRIAAEALAHPPDPEIQQLNRAVARVEKATRDAVAAGQYGLVRKPGRLDDYRDLPAAQLRAEADRMLDRAESLFEIGGHYDEAAGLVENAEWLISRAEQLEASVSKPAPPPSTSRRVEPPARPGRLYIHSRAEYEAAKAAHPNGGSWPEFDDIPFDPPFFIP